MSRTRIRSQNPFAMTSAACGFATQKLGEYTSRRMAVILPHLQAAAVALDDETHLPFILVEGIDPGAMEQKAHPVLLRAVALQQDPRCGHR